ncbi:MAG TPA: phosphopantothenoylcysteine decarboxylase, partial [Methanomassiliicoccales archaeon]|nr:phosphopantothenoylcysteine decarboxylase [Methanomassiliicoccales archaeon]
HALVPAALSDFTFDRERGKLPSEAKATALQLKSVPKVLPSLKERCPKVIGFKAESGLGEEGLIAEARASLKRYGLAAVAANDLKDVRPGSTRIVLVKARGRKVLEGSKADVARMLIAEAARL